MTTDEEIRATKFYKVLRAGQSCDGGFHKWSLPTEDGPGDWHEIPSDMELRLCAVGFHITRDPVAGGWFAPDRTVYAVEFEGEYVGPSCATGDKIAARKVRLVKALDPEELEALRIVSSGYHEAKDGIWYASGSSTVTAYDSSTVRASGSSTVRAYDSSTVTAYDSSTVTAYDSSTVPEAKGWAVITQRPGSRGTVAISENAVRIDQRGERPRCYRAKKRLPTTTKA